MMSFPGAGFGHLTLTQVWCISFLVSSGKKNNFNNNAGHFIIRLLDSPSSRNKNLGDFGVAQLCYG